MKFLISPALFASVLLLTPAFARAEAPAADSRLYLKDKLSYALRYRLGGNGGLDCILKKEVTQ